MDTDTPMQFCDPWLPRYAAAIRPRLALFRNPDRHGWSRIECWRSDRALLRILADCPYTGERATQFVAAALEWTHLHLSQSDATPDSLWPDDTFAAMVAHCATGAILLGSIIASGTDIKGRLLVCGGVLDGVRHAWLEWVVAKSDVQRQWMLLDWTRSRAPIPSNKATDYSVDDMMPL